MEVDWLISVVSSHLSVKILHAESIGGGSINAAFKLTSSSGCFFCKLNSATKFPHLLQKEKNGLELIKQSGAIGTPAIIGCFEANNLQVLVLEWIKETERTEAFWENFGTRLAAMHAICGQYFGLTENNYMGSVEQDNAPNTNWISFFREQRLQPLIVKCYEQHYLEPGHLKQFDKLWTILPDFFNPDQVPVLIHGDLWHGNFLCGGVAEPLLIDPAVYFGHPSMDLAMSSLFGGFKYQFYNAYQFYHPFSPGYKEQWDICNLYPLLIHLHLFGTVYKNQVERILKKYN